MTGEPAGRLSDLDRDELRELLRAGVKVARLRRLRIMCRHGRELGHVLRVGRTDVLVRRVARVGESGDADQAGELTTDSVTLDAGTYAVDLATARATAVADMSNRCCSRAATVAELRDAITRGKRTLVLR
jgi:chromosome condensin MukBEF MukE localization factor